jgi:hypothetical protein
MKQKNEKSYYSGLGSDEIKEAKSAKRKIKGIPTHKH